MIFKPSSLPKLFFTYICPRFYGGAPSVPSNTTTTSTVNQSPWQNPVYQALMLGTKEKPGPITNMLNASNDQMAQWNNINRVGLTPAAQASLGTWNPSTADTTATYTNKSAPISATTSQDVANSVTDFRNTIEGNNLLNSAYQTSLGRAPDAPGQAYWLGRLNDGVSKQDVAKSIADSQEAKAYAAKNASAVPVPGAAQGGLMGLRGYASGGDMQKAAQEAFGRPMDDAEVDRWKSYYPNASYKSLLKSMQETREGLQRTVDTGGTITDAQNNMLSNWNTYKDQIYAGIIKLDASGNPVPNIPQGATKAETAAANAAFAKATDAGTGKAPYGLTDTLSKTAYFDPVTGKSTLNDFLAIQEKARNLETPEQFKAATDMYGQSSAGLAAAANYKPTNISANKADVANAKASGYNASNMKAPTNIKALDYDAAQANAAQLGRSSVRDIAAQKAQVESYKAEMMNAPSDISAQNYQAALADLNQMQGPKSWTDQGTSAQYMSPYMQNVVDIQKREANRDYQQQLNQLNAQSVQAGAFGGSRQAIQQAEAARNQATRLGDIEAKGLQEAYASGMGQFTNEQGQQLQAGQANLSAAQQTAQQNQTAINQQRALYVQQALDAAKVIYGGQLTAAQQNQVAQNAASQFNASAQNLANNNYSAQQLQAQQANQGVDFNVGQMNTTNQQQTNLANQTATNQQRALYVQQALQAAQVNYGGQLTAAQQNQVAQNASAQYNATNAQNVNLANANAANTANNAYAQNQLQAQQANQTAGLQANQQGIAALQGVGQNASGLAQTGSAQNAANLANLGAAGQVAQAEQNLGQQYLDTQTRNAQSWLNMPTSINSGAVNAINTQNVQGGTTGTTTSAKPASAFGARGGLIKNGKVSKRGKK